MLIISSALFVAAAGTVSKVSAHEAPNDQETQIEQRSSSPEKVKQSRTSTRTRACRGLLCIAGRIVEEVVRLCLYEWDVCAKLFGNDAQDDVEPD